MKKKIMALLLALIFTSYTFAGDTPIMGYAGCEGGLWYPIAQICCMPDLECPVGLSAPVSSATTKDTILVELISMLKNIYF
jgi:hypothetical protein